MALILVLVCVLTNPLFYAVKAGTEKRWLRKSNALALPVPSDLSISLEGRTNRAGQDNDYGCCVSIHVAITRDI